MTAEIVVSTLILGNALFAYGAIKNHDNRQMRAHIYALVGLGMAYGFYKMVTA